MLKRIYTGHEISYSLLAHTVLSHFNCFLINFSSKLYLLRTQSFNQNLSAVEVDLFLIGLLRYFEGCFKFSSSNLEFSLFLNAAVSALQLNFVAVAYNFWVFMN